jgi:serine/threonine protein kinase
MSSGHKEKILILEALTGPSQGKRLEVPFSGTLVFGRSHAVDVVIEGDRTVSRLHCMIGHAKDRVWIEDVDSTGGTFVNNVRIEEAHLSDGDLIRIGKTQYRTHIYPYSTRCLLAGLDEIRIRPESLLGQVFRDYKLIEVIAKGNKSVVFDAFHVKAAVPAALRIIFDDQLLDGIEQGRFTESIKLAVKIKHPHVVPVIAAGKKYSFPWIAMQRIKGENLRTLVRNKGSIGMLNWQVAFRVCKDITLALAHLHEEHLLHRNISPTNILVRNADKMCFLDDLLYAQRFDWRIKFQIPELVEEIYDLRYSSPEVIGGKKLDIRTDIYSLGAACYAIMAGRPPFHAEDPTVLFEMIRNSKPERIRTFQMAVPELFEDVVLKMLEKRREDRFQDPQELFARLAKIEKVIGYTGMF